MALKSIELEDFRGNPKSTFTFDPKMNFIRGKNGAGKTTIREGICFAFCGTDSVGTRNPQHLIRTDQPSTKVTVKTDKAEISRTLTRKGSSTIKLIRAGVPQTLTQKQLEQMLGPMDLFLSIFVPGYFLDLTPQKQTDVINGVMPEIDRYALLKEISGMELLATEDEKYKLGLRRPDIVATSIAQDRRTSENELNRLKGQRDTLGAIKPIDKPVQPPEIAQMKLLDILRGEWQQYEDALDNWSQLNIRSSRIADENSAKRKRKAVLEKDLKSLENVVVPGLEDFSSSLAEAESLRPAPIDMPSTMRLPSSELCPTCGQTVGLKHREKITKMNEETEAKHKKDLTRVKAEMAKVNEAVAQIKSTESEGRNLRDKCVEQNYEVNRKRLAIELEISKLDEEEVPSCPKQKPTPPEKEYDPDEYDKCFLANKAYNTAVNQYDYVQKELTHAAENISKIDITASGLVSACERYNQLEKAIKQIPQEEMKRQMAALEMGEVKITVDSGVKITYQGVPYSILSSGNAMKANSKICLKLNELSKRPLNMVFLDNFDLIDEFEIPGPIQWFAAQVVAGQDNLTILHQPV